VCRLGSPPQDGQKTVAWDTCAGSERNGADHRFGVCDEFVDKRASKNLQCLMKNINKLLLLIYVAFLF
jgi:hypothetical protein